MFISRHVKNEETANEIIRRLGLKGKGNNLYTCVGGFQIYFDNKESKDLIYFLNLQCYIFLLLIAYKIHLLID